MASAATETPEARVPLARQLPFRTVSPNITLRDQLWKEAKQLIPPDPARVGKLRTANDAVLGMLEADPPPFSPALNHVEILLSKLCAIFLARRDLEIAAQGRPGAPSGIDLEFVRRSFELAAAEEELPPPEL